jgi:hypothetical protein
MLGIGASRHQRVAAACQSHPFSDHRTTVGKHQRAHRGRSRDLAGLSATTASPRATWQGSHAMSSKEFHGKSWYDQLVLARLAEFLEPGEGQVALGRVEGLDTADAITVEEDEYDKRKLDR